MLRYSCVALAIAIGGLHANAATLEVVKVVKADLLQARVAGETTTLHLGGVWAPSPPGVDKVPHYLGEAARELVERLLAETPATFEPYGHRGDGQPTSVRITLDGGEDLATMLAGLGMALCDRPTAASPAHGQGVCSAERAARRGHVGIHDGGFQEFAQAQGHVVDLGLVFFWVGGGRRGNPVDVSSGSRGANWGTTKGLPPMRTVVESIRDWGASMGLPPDSSSMGY